MESLARTARVFSWPRQQSSIQPYSQHFAKSALARYTPWDFCTLMAEHDLTWHEKTLGQLFCDQKSGAVIKMLLDLGVERENILLDDFGG